MIVLHHPVRFVEVTEEVHRRIVADQYAEVDYARRVHETFTDLSMRRPSLDEIVAVAADMLGTPVVLEDLNRQVLAFAGHGVPTTELLADWERRSRLTPADRPAVVAEPPGRPVSAGVGPVDRADAPRTPTTDARRHDDRTLPRRRWRCTGWSSRTAPRWNCARRAVWSTICAGRGSATRPRRPRGPTPWGCVRR